MATQYATVDDYIAAFPDDVQAILRKVRTTLLKAVPGAGSGSATTSRP